MFASNLDRVELQLLGNLIELDFERIAWLRRAVSAFWATWRFVGERADALKLIARYVISNGLQRAGVERARDTITPISPAVEIRLKVHCGDRAVVLHAGFDFHQHGMPATMAIEDFFARQRHLYRAPGQHRELAN